MPVGQRRGQIGQALALDRCHDPAVVLDARSRLPAAPVVEVVACWALNFHG
ncbi:MAG: hypothetical protein V9E94_17235 [Microthrixaceae bacterium]